MVATNPTGDSYISLHIVLVITHMDDLRSTIEDRWREESGLVPSSGLNECPLVGSLLPVQSDCLSACRPRGRVASCLAACHPEFTPGWALGCGPADCPQDIRLGYQPGGQVADLLCDSHRMVAETLVIATDQSRVHGPLYAV